MRNGLAQLRVFKELKVGDVACALGVGYGTVLSWERWGGQLPGRRNLLALAELYDVDPHDICRLRKQLFRHWKGE